MLKYRNLIFIMTILPWFSLPFLGIKNIKRFIPGALFIATYVTIEGFIAEKKKWWWFFHKANPNVLGELPLIVGPFFIGTLWTLKYTFGNFKKYLITNFIVDSFFTYVMVFIFKKMGYVSLVRLTKFRLSLLFLIKSLALYGFQYWYELRKTKDNSQLDSH